MVQSWNDSVPIYRQLRDRVVAMILDGDLKEGEAVPSVRQVAVDYQINPLTVSKAYQDLVDEDLLEKRRGLGLFVQLLKIVVAAPAQAHDRQKKPKPAFHESCPHG